MKIIFVGLHNKPNKTPLDSSTRSGKLIDRIINEGGFDAGKTNLFDVDAMPIIDNDKARLLKIFQHRNRLNKSKLFILLGNDVNKYFPQHFFRFISIYHPASRRSHQQMNDYVKDAIKKINAAISKQ